MDDREHSAGKVDAAHSSASGVVLPPAGGAAKRVFSALCVICLAASFALPMLSSEALRVWQSTRAENATAMVSESLEDGRKDKALNNAEHALDYFPTRNLQGEALVLLAPPYARMSEQLLDAGKIGEGRAAAFRAIRERHRVARALEYVAPWRVLAAHYEAAGNISIAPVRRLLIDHGARGGEIADDDPNENSQAIDFDFEGARPIARSMTGSLENANRRRALPLKLQGGQMRMDRPGAWALPFELSTATDIGYLVASGTELLGVYSILIASIDGGEEFPLYLDDEEVRAFRFPAKLAPGPHEIRLEFVNAHSLRTEHGPERREAVLYGMRFSSEPKEDDVLPQS